MSALCAFGLLVGVPVPAGAQTPIDWKFRVNAPGTACHGYYLDIWGQPDRGEHDRLENDVILWQDGDVAGAKWRVETTGTSWHLKTRPTLPASYRNRYARVRSDRVAVEPHQGQPPTGIGLVLDLVLVGHDQAGFAIVKLRSDERQNDMSGPYLWMGTKPGSCDQVRATANETAAIEFVVLPQGVRSTDVDGDGHADVVVIQRIAAGGASRLHVFRGKGQRSFESPQSVAPIGLETAWPTAMVGARLVGRDFRTDLVAGWSSRSMGNAAAFAGSGAVPHLAPSGWTVDFAGDNHYGSDMALANVGGDASPDLIVGGRTHDPGGGPAEVSVYIGNLDGFTTMPSARVRSPDSDAKPFQFGSPVGSAGDVDGDGLDDVLITQLREGLVYLFYGDPKGLAPTPARLTGPPLSSPNGDWFGHALVGDLRLNDDRLADFAVALPYDRDPNDADDADRGSLWLYSGSSRDSFVAEPVKLYAPTDPRCRDDDACLRFGWRAINAGDIDDDGIPDIVATDADWNVWVISGPEIRKATAEGIRPRPWRGVSVPRPADCVAPENGHHVRLAPLGDLDGDGFDDFAIGAPYWGGCSTPVGPGRVFLVYGARRGADASVVEVGAPNGDGMFGAEILGMWPMPVRR